MANPVAAFDPERLSFLRAVFDAACADIPPDARTQEHRTVLAERILKLAAAGETDPARLRAAALQIIPA